MRSIEGHILKYTETKEVDLDDLARAAIQAFSLKTTVEEMIEYIITNIDMQTIINLYKRFFKNLEEVGYDNLEDVYGCPTIDVLEDWFDIEEYRSKMQ